MANLLCQGLIVLIIVIFHLTGGEEVKSSGRAAMNASSTTMAEEVGDGPYRLTPHPKDHPGTEKVIRFISYLTEPQRALFRLLTHLDDDGVQPIHWPARNNLTVVMYGDSTMIAQSDTLCDLLIGPTKATNARMEGKDVRYCQGKGWGATRLNIIIMQRWLLTQFDRDMHLLDKFASSNNLGSVDVVYFGAASLHYMHLATLRPSYTTKQWTNTVGEYKILHLVDDIHSAVKSIHDIKAIPVFQTVHSVCTSAYRGAYAAALAPAFASQVHSYCSQATGGDPHRMDLCTLWTMTKEGSDFAVKTELEAVQGCRGPAVDVVDAHNITANKCHLTNVKDGRHYPPLVPVELRELGRIIHKHLLLGAFS
jgi:hypothetical protein